MSLCYSHYVEMLFGAFKIRQTKNQTHRTLIIIYLPREPLRCYVSRRTQGRRLVLMVTYSDLFTFVIMLCAVITLVVTIIKHKK